MQKEKKKVLFCSEDKLIQKVIKRRLEQGSYAVDLAADGNEAAQLIEKGGIDILVTEEQLPFQSGLEIIKRCDELDIPSILISDSDLENKILEAFDLGAYDFIDKPYSPNELFVRVKNVLTHHVS